MKIMYIIHQFYPEYKAGTEKVLLNIATMMQQSGNKVKILTYSFYDDSFYDQNIDNIIFKEFTYKGISVIAFKHKKLPIDLHYSLKNSDIANIARYILEKEKPDIVHMIHPMRMIEFIKISKILGIPYITTLTDYFLICPKVVLSTYKGSLCTGPDKGIICHKLCQELPTQLISERLNITEDILLNSKKIICPSKFMASIFKKEFKYVDIQIINHGIDFNLIKKNKKTYIKGDNIVFCYAGTLANHKGVHILLNAIKDIPENNNLTLKIYGSGVDNQYIDKLKNIINGDNRIEMCGAFAENNIGNVFSNVDIIVVPSLCYESYSLVLHEALSSNVPVIASNVGVVTEKIKDGINGFTFRVGDPSHLKDIIEIIMKDPEILNILKNGIKKETIPTIEQEGYKYEKEYRQIVRKN